MAMAKSFFHDIEAVPVDETFRLLDQFNSDTNPKKVNLGIGGIVNIISKAKTICV
jgi:aspartate/tyrosine/aromatic aminotransferase